MLGDLYFISYSCALSAIMRLEHLEAYMTSVMTEDPIFDVIFTKNHMPFTVTICICISVYDDSEFILEIGLIYCHIFFIISKVFLYELLGTCNMDYPNIARLC